MLTNLLGKITLILMTGVISCPYLLGMEKDSALLETPSKKRKKMMTYLESNSPSYKKHAPDSFKEVTFSVSQQKELKKTNLNEAVESKPEEVKLLELSHKEKERFNSYFIKYNNSNDNKNVDSVSLFNDFISKCIDKSLNLFNKYKIEITNNKKDYDFFIDLVNNYFSSNERKLVKIHHIDLTENDLIQISNQIVFNLNQYLLDFSSKDDPLLKSAEIGNPIAQYWYSMLNGNIDFLHQSAAQGYAEALYDLSKLYLYPTFWEQPENIKNKPFAYILCKEAARKGHEEAEFSFASSFLEGTYGEKIDEKKGEEILDFFAKKGNKIAERAIVARNRIKEFELELS